MALMRSHDDRINPPHWTEPDGSKDPSTEKLLRSRVFFQLSSGSADGTTKAGWNLQDFSLHCFVCHVFECSPFFVSASQKNEGKWFSIGPPMITCNFTGQTPKNPASLSFAFPEKLIQLLLSVNIHFISPASGWRFKSKRSYFSTHFPMV